MILSIVVVGLGAGSQSSSPRLLLSGWAPPPLGSDLNFLYDSKYGPNYFPMLNYQVFQSHLLNKPPFFQIWHINNAGMFWYVLQCGRYIINIFSEIQFNTLFLWVKIPQENCFIFLITFHIDYKEKSCSFSKLFLYYRSL